MTYRIEIPATICFDVDAPDEDEARLNAVQKLTDAMDGYGGFDLPELSDDARVYPKTTNDCITPDMEAMEVVDEWDPAELEK